VFKRSFLSPANSDFAPYTQKKPTAQARKLDTIGFLKDDYLTASFYKGYTS